MMKEYTLIILLFIASFFSCSDDVSGVVDISIDDLKEVLKKDKDIQILDVRLPSETKNGMILNSVNVNLISNSFQSKAVGVLDKEKPVYVYCRSGNRSRIASEILIDKGYEVFNVKGGYLEWQKEEKE